MNQRLLLCLEERQLIELQQLVIDEDQEGALNFLTSVVWPKLEAAMRQSLQNEIDKGKHSGDLPG